MNEPNDIAKASTSHPPDHEQSKPSGIDVDPQEFIERTTNALSLSTSSINSPRAVVPKKSLSELMRALKKQQHRDSNVSR